MSLDKARAHIAAAEMYQEVIADDRLPIATRDRAREDTLKEIRLAIEALQEQRGNLVFTPRPEEAEAPTPETRWARLARWADTRREARAARLAGGA